MPRPARSPAPILLLALFTLGLPALLTAQTPDVSELFGETVDVRVVNLEVVVTDRGDRVHDLTSDDFVLLVDGQETPIEFFSEVRGGYATRTVSPQAAAVPALEPGAPVGQRILVFIDDVFIIKPRRNQILRQLGDELNRLGPNDSMAIVAYDGNRVDMLSSWTNSTRDLERALRRAEDRPSYGLRNSLRWRTEYEYDLFRDRDFSRGIGIPRLDLIRRNSWSYGELSGVLDAATSTLRAFARPDGRKVMLMLSGDWPVNFTADAEAGELAYAGGRPNGRILEPLVDTANLLGYTLYPVDAPRVRNRFADASAGSLREAEFNRTVDRNLEWDQDGQLVTLARQTGGKALLNGGGRDMLARVQEDARTYYSIGFTPTWQANDVRHSVKVKLRGDGKVRMRRSFTDLSAATEATFRLQSAQLFDLPVPGAEALSFAFGEPQKGGLRRVLVPLKVEIPLDRLSYVPTDRGWATRLELRVAVTDDRGNRADIPVVPIILESADPPPAGATSAYEVTLKMRQRPHSVMASLVDTVSGKEMAGQKDIAF
ncbi:MAG: VWA domain-containing protein [Acidobacteriota bacterium]